MYKVVPRQFLMGLLDGSSVKIGTLHDFRRTEAHGGLRGDPMEGRSHGHLQHMQILENDSQVADKLAALKTVGIVLGGNNAGSQVSNVVMRRSVRDCLVFCASLTSDPAAYRGLDHEDPVCVRIRDPKRFFLALTGSLVKRVPGVGDGLASPVIYDRRSVEVGVGSHLPEASAFHKNLDFQHQQEFRLVWELDRPPPAGGVILPFRSTGIFDRTPVW